MDDILVLKILAFSLSLLQSGVWSIATSYKAVGALRLVHSGLLSPTLDHSCLYSFSLLNAHDTCMHMYSFRIFIGQLNKHCHVK